MKWPARGFDLGEPEKARTVIRFLFFPQRCTDGYWHWLERAMLYQTTRVSNDGHLVGWETQYITPIVDARKKIDG